MHPKLATFLRSTVSKKMVTENKWLLGVGVLNGAALAVGASPVLAGICGSLFLAGQVVKRWDAYKEQVAIEKKSAPGTYESVINAFNAAVDPNSNESSAAKANSYRNVLSMFKNYDTANPERIGLFFVSKLCDLDYKIDSAISRSQKVGDNADALVDAKKQLREFSAEHVNRVAISTFTYAIAYPTPTPNDESELSNFLMALRHAADANNDLKELNPHGATGRTDSIVLDRIRQLTSKLDSVEAVIKQNSSMQEHYTLLTESADYLMATFARTKTLVVRGNEDKMRSAWDQMFDSMYSDIPLYEYGTENNITALETFQEALRAFSEKGTMTSGAIFIVDQFSDIIKRNSIESVPGSVEALRLEKLQTFSLGLLQTHAVPLAKNCVNNFYKRNTKENSYGELMSNTLGVREAAQLQAIAARVSPDAARDAGQNARIEDKLAYIKSTLALGMDESTVVQIAYAGPKPKEILDNEIMSTTEAIQKMQSNEHTLGQSMGVVVT